MCLLEAVTKPSALLSLSMSDMIEGAENDPTIVEMMGRLLYHSLLNIYHVTFYGRYSSDTTSFDLLHARIRQFSGTS